MAYTSFFYELFYKNEDSTGILRMESWKKTLFSNEKKELQSNI